MKAAARCLGQKQGWMPTISLFSRCVGLASSHSGSVETTAFQTGAALGRPFEHPALTSQCKIPALPAALTPSAPDTPQGHCTAQAGL